MFKIDQNHNKKQKTDHSPEQTIQDTINPTETAKELDKAVENNDSNQIKQLIISIVNQEKPIDPLYRSTTTGESLIHLATKIFYLKGEVYHKLFKLGCPVNSQDNNGKTPFDNLTTSNWQFKLLKEAEAEQSKIKFENELESHNRIHPGTYFTNNLNLFYKKKCKTPEHSERTCGIPDKWVEHDQHDQQQNISLHQRLAMIEAFSLSNTGNITELRAASAVHEANSVNYATANLGFVVSTKPITSSKDHELTFITVPIDDPTYLIFRSSRNDGPHSEIVLYDYLKDEKNLERIINNLSNKLKQLYGSDEGHKVYAVILDIHTSRDMCNGCREETFLTQKTREESSLLLHLEHILEKNFKYILPREKTDSFQTLPTENRRLHFVTRISSHTDNSVAKPEPTFKLWNNTTFEYSKEKKSQAENTNFHITNFHNSVILHTLTDTVTHENFNFYNKEKYKNLASPNTSFFAVPRQTVFANTNTKTQANSKNTSQDVLKVKFN